MIRPTSSASTRTSRADGVTHADEVTGLVNALRAHLAEFGIIAPQGLRNVGRLIAIVRDEDDARLPDLARQVLEVLAAQIEQLELAVVAIEKQLMAWHKSSRHPPIAPATWRGAASAPHYVRRLRIFAPVPSHALAPQP